MTIAPEVASPDEALIAEAEIALGNAAMRAVTIVTGEVHYDPPAPNQMQPFANWAESTLSYRRIIIPIDSEGNVSIPKEYDVVRHFRTTSAYYPS